jgi:geranylgeranyl pyrophosphate synthase
LNTAVSFSLPVQEDLRSVESLIRAQVEGYHIDLAKALELLLSSGGKRIRPNLTLLIGHMFNAPKSNLITLAAAIELLHTATLVHDDLIDGSILRRGMPTLNAHWSPAATILTGDFLFSCAARLAAETDSIEVMQLFSRTLSVIVNGELTQLFASHCKISREDYYQRIYAKTASLFETSAKTAAIISHADPKAIESIRQYGLNIGMAFQIMDDLLDFTGEQVILGKPVGNDLRQGLITLPLLYYLEINPSDPDAQSLLAGECIKEDARIERLINSVRNSKSIQLTYDEAYRYTLKSKEQLASLPAGEERRLLEELAEYIILRNI